MRNNKGTLGGWIIPILLCGLIVGVFLLRYSEPVYRDVGEFAHPAPTGDIIGLENPYENIAYSLIVVSGLCVIGFYTTQIFKKSPLPKDR